MIYLCVHKNKNKNRFFDLRKVHKYDSEYYFLNVNETIIILWFKFLFYSCGPNTGTKSLNLQIQNVKALEQSRIKIIQMCQRSIQ